MNLVNCKKCGKLFKQGLREICDSCIAIEQEKINRITQFVTSTPEKTYTINEISEGTKINAGEIEHFFKKRRLLQIENAIIIKCKICGASLLNQKKRANFCDKCVENMVNEEIIVKQEKKIPPKPSSKPKNTKKEELDVVLKEKQHFGFKKSYD